MAVTWTDVHTHINMLERDEQAVLEAARTAGIERMITIGTGRDDHARVVDMVTRLTPWVFGTLGFHPHDAKDFTDADERYMRAHLADPRIVGVGEIGLDYYYSHSERAVQREVFRKQMAIAAEFNMPVEIHTRDAEADTAEILREFQGRVRGLLHCFTGTQWLADEGLALGYNISISGVVTFKNADVLRSVVKNIPLDRLHLETDAPFLAPVPHRGKKNEPALMVHTAQVVADLKGISLEQLARATNENARALFKKLQ